MRIGHLSDIHVWEPSDLRRRDWINKRATGMLNHRLNRSSEYDPVVVGGAVAALVDAAPDLVVVSGDLSNFGLRSEYVRARELLQPLHDAGIRVAVIPGNHDYYVRAASQGEFEQVFADELDADRREGDHTYPWVALGDGVGVLLFNSALPRVPLVAAGRVGTSQLERGRRLGRALRDEGRAVVVALHHHPIRAPHKRFDRPRALENASAFRDLCVELGAELVLHGHNHVLHMRRIGSAKGPLVCGISSGTTTRVEPDPRVARAGLYEVDAGGLRSVAFSCWRPSERSFGAFQPFDVDGVPLES